MSYITIGIVLFLFVMPFKCFYSAARYELGIVLKNILIAPFG